MLYIVEMALKAGHTDKDWYQWESEMKSAAVLMTVAGFRAAQRFKGVTDAMAYCGIYSIAAPEVMTSPEYRNVGGGTRVEHWNSHITYWHRDMVEGVGIAPAVPQGYSLLVTSSDRADFSDHGFPFIRLDVTGLNKSVAHRGIAVVPDDVAKSKAALEPDIRIYRPIAPQLLNISP